MKKIIASICIFSLIGLFAFQTKSTKTQFFVIGCTYFNTNSRSMDSKFEVTLNGKTQYFSSRYDMLKAMNNDGYSVVSVAFNTYRQEGFEVYIFE